MAGIKERLIQFILRGRDELSPEARKSAEALEKLKQEANQLGTALDNTKATQGLVKSLEQTGRAVEQTKRYLEQAEKLVTDLQRSLSESPKSRGLQLSLREAEREAARTRRQLGSLEQQLAELEKSAKAAGIDTRNLSAEERRLADDVESVRKALDDANGRLKEAQRQQAAAARAASEHASRMESVSSAMASVGRRALALAAAYLSVNSAVGLLKGGLSYLSQGIRAVAGEGSGQQQALAQLEATLASTGRQAEFTTQQLLEMADALEARSMLSSEQIQAAQARLLSYTDVAANEFPRALQIVIDQQQRLGISVEQSAEIVGRALQSPSEAIATLGRQGFKLEDSQKRLLKQLEATGRMAEAQAIIMDMLTEAYGGSAAAARLGTFDGLLKGITDRFGDFADRIARSGAFEFMQRKLQEFSNYLDEMANDGRLDRLAEAISKAFIEGAEKVEAFARKLLEIDFRPLTDDVSRWLDNFGEKLETTGRWITMISMPVRTLVNMLTGGISAIGVAFTSLVTMSLSLMSHVAKAIPEAFGGEKIVKGLESARDTAASMMRSLASQVVQDGRDIAAVWRDVATEAEDSAARQSDAIKRATEENKRRLQQAGDEIMSHFRSNIVSLENALAAITFAETDEELKEVEEGLHKSSLSAEELAQALEALSTKRGFVTVGQDAATAGDQLAKLRAEQKRLADEYFAGTKTLEEWQQGHNEAAAAIRKLEAASGGTAQAAKSLTGELKSLADVQRAIGSARTDRDIAAIQSALKKLYDTGVITAAEYNAEMKQASERQKELKSSVERTAKAGRDAGEQLTRAQQMYNDALEDGILTNEELRRISGQRMEEERRASGEAMERHRKGVDATQRDLAAMESFFSGVMSRAREPLAAMSAAALRFYDQLRGIASAEIRIDHSNLDATRRSLEQVSERLAEIQAELGNPMTSALGRWALETQRASLATQQAFLSQKAHLQSLMRDYESGRMSARRFVESATAAKRAMGLLDESDLSSLESAIHAAQQRMQQLGQSTRSTLESLQDELDQLQGRTEDIERRRFAARRRELEAQLAEAQAGGDSQAIANAARALGMLRQIEAETEQKRLADQQKARQEELARAKETTSAPKASEPSKIIRLEVPGRQAVEVGVNSPEDETKLLGILEAAGLRSL